MHRSSEGFLTCTRTCTLYIETSSRPTFCTLQAASFVMRHKTGQLGLMFRWMMPPHRINKRGEVKVSDFGVSTQLKDTLGLAETFTGTVTYMDVRSLRRHFHSCLRGECEGWWPNVSVAALCRSAGTHRGSASQQQLRRVVARVDDYGVRPGLLPLPTTKQRERSTPLPPCFPNYSLTHVMLLLVARWCSSSTCTTP